MQRKTHKYMAFRELEIKGTMYYPNRVIEEDANTIINSSYIKWEKLRNSCILVTGATGLIGSMIVFGLLAANKKFELNLTIIAFVRDKNRAFELFGKTNEKSGLKYIVGSMESTIDIEEPIDYIIHGAGSTDNTYFVSNPVETIETSIKGSYNLLKIAWKQHIKKFVYLSTMEVYGAPAEGKLVDELYPSNLDTMSVRSSYPEAKRLVECLCASFCQEYHVPVNVVRLTQTFGPGVKGSDKRVFAEFGRCVIEKQDIVLRTNGESGRCYLYTGDAVTAILTVLLHGENGKAYNAANQETFCSIYEMAQMVAHEVAKDLIKVTISIDKEQSKKFSPKHHINLDCTRLLGLGWNPVYVLKEMYLRMIEVM